MTFKSNIFVVENDTNRTFDIYVEPEGVLVPLLQNEKIIVKDPFVLSPVTLRLQTIENDKIVLAIWPGDGDTIVEKDGVNVLDLI
ncbi:MAG: hypothetical protein COA78_23765 [Blastopirellula sp.]|nr:MAG: hypothetical protein COA78_23765 [Blastopirellula sp.]